jgi:hypothetical protein
VVMVMVMDRGRKDEKRWARAEADPIKIFETAALSEGRFTEEQLEQARARASAVVKQSVDFAAASPPPPRCGPSLSLPVYLPACRPDPTHRPSAAVRFAPAGPWRRSWSTPTARTPTTTAGRPPRTPRP